MATKGYKGFGPGMVCRDKQYAENTVFEEPEAKICAIGMHFCENPLDVLDFYPVLNDGAEPNEFAEVEALADVHTDDNNKYCTTKMRVGAKLDLKGLIKASVDFMMEKASKTRKKDCSQLDASGNYSKLAASGFSSQLAASGNYSQLAASGFSSQLAASGDYSHLAASGDCSKLAASGFSSQLAASGNYSQLAASGNCSQLAASGFSSKLAASGNYSQLAASGNSSKLAASGNYSHLAASGNYSHLAASGKYSIAAGIGIGNIAKTAKGCWIVLAEWKHDGANWIPVAVKAAQVDGEKIKADTWYKLKNGEFVEV